MSGGGNLKLRGIVLCIAIAIAATCIGNFAPIVGSMVVSILIGIIVGNTMNTEPYNAGIKFSGKKLLQYAIILMGFTLSFKSAVQLGISSFPLIITSIVAALLVSYILGSYLGINTRIKTLIGVGTAICGGSAIAAASPIIKAKDEEIAFSITTIFLFNIIAVFIFPPLGHLLHFSDTGFGYFAGTAINDTSSVVAAGYAYSTSAGDTATIVKLVRALMIVPICLILVALQSSKDDFNIKQVFPWFILYFFLASVFASIVPIPHEAVKTIKVLSNFLMCTALAGIGLSVNLPKFFKIGSKPIALGAVTWMVVIMMSLIMQKVLQIW